MTNEMMMMTKAIANMTQEQENSFYNALAKQGFTVDELNAIKMQVTCYKMDNNEELKAQMMEEARKSLAA